MGTLDLQSSMQVFLMTAERTDTTDATRSGRSDMQGGAPGRNMDFGRGMNFGRGGDSGRTGFPGPGEDFGRAGGRGRGGTFGTLTIINAK